MNSEKLELCALTAYGLARGLFNVYVRPLPNDALTWLAGRLVDFEMPDQEAIDALIAEQSQPWALRPPLFSGNHGGAVD